MQIQIEGLDRLMDKVSPELLGKPLRNFLHRATITIQSKARQNAPVDTGRLRASIGTKIDSGALPKWGETGTNVSYARPVEYGTGTLSVASDSKRTPHFPPGGALDVWARRHGASSGWAVAAAIGRRGGLRPRLYLTKAIQESVSEIRGFVTRMGDEIRQGWDH